MQIKVAWRDLLARRLDELGLPLEAAARECLLEYIALLAQWNAAYNLTAVREPLAMIDRHLVDALALLPHAQGPDLADIGTGPGVPGLVLALVHDYERVWLVDSNGKKARFLRECKRRFGLPRVEIHEQRAEQLPVAGFHQVVSRAYASLALFVASTRQVLADEGIWLALKGRRPDAEIAALPDSVEVIEVLRLRVPGADGERHLVRMRLR